jgi:hypothetical protein
MDKFDQGFFVAISVLLAGHDVPSLAADTVREAGYQDADLSCLDDFDKGNLRKIKDERGINFKGL